MISRREKLKLSQNKIQEQIFGLQVQLINQEMAAGNLILKMPWDTWVAQQVKRLTLHLSSGLHLRDVSSSPELGSTLGMEPTLKKEKKVLSNI